MCERLSKMDREYKDYSYKLKFHILYDEIEVSFFILSFSRYDHSAIKNKERKFK